MAANICNQLQLIGKVDSINLHAAKARKQSRGGFAFPSWLGCFVQTASEVFLLNDNPNSLDGRYLGVMQISDLEGRGRLIWKTK